MPALVVVGLAARFGPGGWVADAAGGVLYTALVYVLVALLRPGWRPPVVAAAALAWSAAMEALQWTGLAAELVDAWSPLRLVVGTSFVAADLAAYALGAWAAMAVDERLSGLRASRGAVG